MKIVSDDYELLIQMKFEEYPLHFKVSSKTRPKYIKKSSKKIPKKYESNIGILYDWDDVTDCLYNIKTGLLIDTNPISGEAKYKKINGQNVTNLTMKDYEKGKISDLLFKFYTSNLKRYQNVLQTIQPNSKLLIQITYNINEKEFEDIDNHSLLYQKILFDSFLRHRYKKLGNKKIKTENKYGFLDDDNKHNIKSYCINWKELDENKKHFMTIKIFKPKQ